MPALTTVRGVAIARVGDWDTSTGRWVVDRDDLADAVRAASDPAFRSGVLKIGHTDPRFNTPDHDGTPVLGRLENLRLDDDGDVLLADLVGVPTWLAEVMASAYPSRSVEASLGVVTSDGRAYRMVVTGLSLLGETPPAIESLGDVAALFAQDTDVDTWVAARAVAATLTPPGGTMPTVSQQATQTAGQVAASAPLDELLNAATAQARAETGQPWIWVREVWTDNLILDDDDGRLWRMDWTEAGGKFEFGSLVPVKVTYTPISDNVAARAAHKMAVPVHYGRGRGDVSASTPAEGEQPVAELGAKLRERYGLPADADDDAVLAAIDAAVQPPAPQEESGTPSGETPTPATHPSEMQDASQQEAQPAPDDIEARIAAAVNKQMAPVLERLGTVSAELADRKAREAAETKKNVIEAALADGKITPADRAGWEADYDAAPNVTTQILARLAPGTAFPVTASGRAGVSDAEADDLDAENAKLFGTVTRG